MPKKPFTTQKDLVLAKLKKYCAYRDRCHGEVRDKLLKMEIYGDLLEEVLAELILEGFLNEERYARSYVRGKFRINHWGRIKIRQGLKAKKIPEALIKLGLEEIEEEEYVKTLRNLLDKKAQTISEKNPAILKKKLITYAMGRGFEYASIIELLGD